MKVCSWCGSIIKDKDITCPLCKHSEKSVNRKKNSAESLNDKLQYAEKLFEKYKVKELMPILKELSGKKVSKAKYMLALIYEVGYTDIPRDFDKVDSLLDECIADGYLPALVRKIIPFQRPAVRNEKTLNELVGALDRLKQLADSGDAIAAEEFARYSINTKSLGVSQENDYTTAIEYFNKAPYILKMHGLARRYEQGQGVKIDLVKSHRLYLKAAEWGYSPSEYKIAQNYFNGWGVNKDLDVAFEWYKIACYHNYCDGIYQLGCCYYYGNGCVKDFSKALELFYMAEKLGNTDAINLIGCILTNSEFSGKDYKKGFEYYEKGAALNCPYCTSNLGWCYRIGRGVEKNIQKAIEYYKKSTEIDPDAAYSYSQLGYVYLNGEGIPVDRAKAKEYFRKAAALGDEDAQKQLKSL